MTDETSLTAEQVRVIASLMEKHLATPNNYPLTMNSLLLACNQKSNRDPVMQLTEGQLGHLVNGLDEQGYVRLDMGERTHKISHKGPGKFSINREEQAVMAILMLRAPLTLNDIKARTEKMVGFASVDDVANVVNGLIDREEPLVVLIPKGAGRREDRYTHLLLGEPDLSQIDVAKPVVSAKPSKLDELEQRIIELEAKIATLLD